MTRDELLRRYAAGERDFRHANLRGADLRNADLTGADLRYADLRDADLRDADLSYADLRDAYLTGADLRYANLRDADLSGAILYRANLSGATLPDGTRAVDRRSTKTAARAVVAYLRRHPDRWVRGQWLYQRKDNGMRGCLHGLCLAEGSGGRELSDALVEAGYDIAWNDEDKRTVDEVIAAVEAVAL